MFKKFVLDSPHCMSKIAMKKILLSLTNWDNKRKIEIRKIYVGMCICINVRKFVTTCVYVNFWIWDCLFYEQGCK